MHVNDSDQEPMGSTEARREHQSPELREKQRKIAAALEALLDRDNVDAFVICSHTTSQEYVQFAVNDQGLILDLPAIPLDADQKQRAIKFFESIDVVIQDSQMLDTPGGREVTKFQVFNVDLKYDSKRGAELALHIFHTVYQLADDFPLTIEEN